MDPPGSLQCVDPWSSHDDERTELEMASPRARKVFDERGVPEAARSDEDQCQVDGGTADVSHSAPEKKHHANGKTKMTMELNLSPRSYPNTPRSMDKLRTARSLLKETETKGTLVERMQILEARITEYMENNDKTLAIILSKLAEVTDHSSRGKLRLTESLAACELLPESEEFHDADQGSGRLESLEAPSGGVGSDDYSQETQPVAATPTAPELSESAQADHDAGTLSPTIPSPQLASTGEETLEPSTGDSEASPKLGERAGQENAAAGEAESVLAGAESPLTSPVMEGEPHQNDRVGAGMEEKHVPRESEYKAAQDMNVPDHYEKPGSFVSFGMVPKPLVAQGAKTKKEKKQDKVVGEKPDKKHSLRAEEKRHESGVAKEMGRKSNSLRTEETSKQPFKHMRDKLRLAFKSK